MTLFVFVLILLYDGPFGRKKMVKCDLGWL